MLVNNEPVRSSYKVRQGDVIELPEIEESEPHDLTPFSMPLEVLYEDEVMMIINKPRGLASHPASSLKEPSLVNVLLARGGELSTVGGEFRPGIVHRLDRETTGLMVIAKKDAAHAHLAQQIEKKSAERRYFVVVASDVDREYFTIDAPMSRNQSNRQQMTVDPQGKPAVTHVKRIARVTAGTLLACRLETGRTHQIRVHLKAIGHPVIGDELYAPRDFHKGPMQLHAGYLQVIHPETGEVVSAYAAPPNDFCGHELTDRVQLEKW